MATLPNCPFDISPLDQSQATATPKLSALSYTNQDFWSMKSRLINFIFEKFPNDFNDFVESSLAMMIIENFAFLADIISFKLDQYINELFIDTVTEVENAFRMARFVGLQPTPPIAATTLFSATLNNVLTADVVIPGGVLAEVSTNDTILSYELYAADSQNNPLFDDDIIIPAGSLTNTTIVGVEGKTLSNNFQGTGLVNQTAQLLTTPVLFDSIRVSVDGVDWQRVDFFTESQPRREFRVEYDSSYTAFVIFGNNIAGLSPAKGSSINVTYRVGGGSIGNIISGALQFTRQFDVPALNFPVPVSFVNYTSGSGGYVGDGIEDIRTKLPAYLLSQNRCVTGEDYKNFVDTFVTPYNGQIGKSTAVLRNYGCAGNIIDIFILALNSSNLGTDINDLTLASDELKYQLSLALDNKKMLTDYCCIRDGMIISVDVSLDITIDKAFKKLRNEIDVRVKQRVVQFFALGNWDYGQTLKSVDLIKQLSGISELKSIDITFTTNNPDNSGTIVTSKYYEIIRPDQIVVNYNFQ
jgi:hypothetical protein